MLKGKDRLVEGHTWWDLDRWRWIGTGADRDNQACRPRKVNQNELRWKLCGAWTVEQESHQDCDRRKIVRARPQTGTKGSKRSQRTSEQHERREEGKKMKTSDLV